MGVALLPITAGNLLTSAVNDYIAREASQGREVLAGANYFWFFTAMMFASAIVYVVWSRFYHGRTYILGDGDGAS